MLKLTNSPAVRVVSTEDLRIPAEPAIQFKVKTVVSQPVNQMMVDWEQEAADVAKARDILGRVFLAVSQDGLEWYPIAGPEGIEAFWQALEEQNPGTADDFILVLLSKFIGNHYGFFTKA